MKSPHRSAFTPVSRRRFLGQLSFGSAALAIGTRAASTVASTTPRKLGVALVGLGHHAQLHVGPALRLTQHCRLAGVVTGDPVKGWQWAHDHGFPEKNVYTYDTVHELADNRDIDIVYVATPNGLHVEHAVAAARAGKHVLCEMPLATTVAECDAIIAACRQAGVKLATADNLEFDPVHRELGRLAREKTFGPFRRMTGASAVCLTSPGWRSQRTLAGGGPLMDVGLHCVRAACHAAGGVAPVAVTARAHPQTRPESFLEIEDGIDWTMEFADGARGEFTASHGCHADEFRAEAAGGWIELRPAFALDGAQANTSRGPLAPIPAPNRQAQQIDEFALCIRENREPRASAQIARRDLAIVAAIYESMRQNGARVAVVV
jgi:glucose-fructose oxidoreductase